MKKMKSLLLLIATMFLLAAMFCFNASAAEWITVDDNVQYSFEAETGVMIIKGSDAVISGHSFGVDCFNHYSSSFCDCADREFDDWPEFTDAEIAANKAAKQTKTLIVQEGITKLGPSVFTEFENVEVVILPQSVTEIPDGAFYYLKKLRTVVLSASTVSVGEAAFACCSSLQSLSLPDSVKSIGDYAFFDCDPDLIRIPKTVEKKGKMLFFPEAKIRTAWRVSQRILEAYPYDGDIQTYSGMFKNCGTEFYSYNKTTGKYTKLGQTNEMGMYIPWDETINTNFIKLDVDIGKYYYICRFYRDIGDRRVYSDCSELITLTVAPQMDKVEFTASKITPYTITLSWEKCANADGYGIYQATKKGWKFLGTTSKLSGTVKNLEPGTTYEFKVIPYAVVEGTKMPGSYEILKFSTIPETPVAKVSSPSKGKVTVSWGETKGAAKYQLYYKVGNGSYKLYKTYDSPQNLTFKNLKSGTKYTFAVRAYWTVTTIGPYVNSKPVSTNYYSAYTPVTVTVK